MENLLEDPQDFIKLVRRYTASAASSIIFGQRAPTYESFWGHVSFQRLVHSLYTFMC